MMMMMMMLMMMKLRRRRRRRSRTSRGNTTFYNGLGEYPFIHTPSMFIYVPLH